MRYELQLKQVGTKIAIFDIENIAEERNDKGEVIKPPSIKETKTDKSAYSVELTLKDTESLNTSNFNTPIMVTVSNKLTLEQCDEAIEKEVEQFLKSINS